MYIISVFVTRGRAIVLLYKLLRIHNNNIIIVIILYIMRTERAVAVAVLPARETVFIYTITRLFFTVLVFFFIIFFFYPVFGT